MYNEQLEKLIELALVDSVITDSELAVIHNKARQQGISADEINMVLDAKIAQKKLQETAKAKQAPAPIDTKNYALDSPLPTNERELRNAISVTRCKAAEKIAGGDFSSSYSRKEILPWITKYNTLVDQAIRVIVYDPDYIRTIKNAKQSFHLRCLYERNKKFLLYILIGFVWFLLIYLPITL